EELEALPHFLLRREQQLLLALLRRLGLARELLRVDVLRRHVCRGLAPQAGLFRVRKLVVENSRVTDIKKLAVELFHGLRVDLGPGVEAEGFGPAAGPVSGRLSMLPDGGMIVVLSAFTDALGEVVGVVTLADAEHQGPPPRSNTCTRTVITQRADSTRTIRECKGVYR